MIEISNRQIGLCGLQKWSYRPKLILSAWSNWIEIGENEEAVLSQIPLMDPALVASNKPRFVDPRALRGEAQWPAKSSRMSASFSWVPTNLGVGKPWAVRRGQELPSPAFVQQHDRLSVCFVKSKRLIIDFLKARCYHSILNTLVQWSYILEQCCMRKKNHHTQKQLLK